MPKTIRVRDVPDAVYRKLSERATDAGLPFSEFLVNELGRRVAAAEVAPAAPPDGATNAPEGSKRLASGELADDAARSARSNE